MSRLMNVVKGDVQCQYKYGFYLVYSLFALLYITVVRSLPGSWQSKTIAIMLFSDPAAMGLFFMGALVLFEKSQRVMDSIAISPMRVGEYIIGKIISIGIIGVVSGLIIAGFSGYTGSYIQLVTGLIFASTLFSLLSLSIASNCKSMNSFFVKCIPFELLLMLPALFHFFGVSFPLAHLHPGVASIYLIEGKVSLAVLYQYILSLMVWILVGLFFCYKSVNKAFAYLGGAEI